MYRCYNPRRLAMLLILDLIGVLLCCACMAFGKSVFSDHEETEGIFLPVVMYHSVTRNLQSDYQITAQQLEEDLQYLKAHGYETISVQMLVDYTAGKGTLPEHPILLTFDDGLYNNLSIALPLLEAYDACAVVSIVGSYTENEAVADPHVDAYSYLTWEDIKELTASGRIELGNHTYDLHENTERAGCSIMYGEDPKAYTAMLSKDLNYLQRAAKENTGITPAAFAYPYGYVCKESVPVLRELGFQCSFTCYERPNDIIQDPSCLFGLDRYNRSGLTTTEEFFERVLQT